MKKFTPDLRGGVTPYTAPVIETVEFRTERGFAASEFGEVDYAGEDPKDPNDYSEDF